MTNSPPRLVGWLVLSDLSTTATTPCYYPSPPHRALSPHRPTNPPLSHHYPTTIYPTTPPSWAIAGLRTRPFAPSVRLHTPLAPRPSPLDPRPSTLDPRPSTLDPRPSTLALLEKEIYDLFLARAYSDRPSSAFRDYWPWWRENLEAPHAGKLLPVRMGDEELAALYPVFIDDNIRTADAHIVDVRCADYVSVVVPCS